MNLKENRALAFVVLAVVIVITLCVQAPLSLLGSRSSAEKLFAEGDCHEMMLRCAEQGALLGQMSDVYLSDAAVDGYASAQTASVLRSGDYTALPAVLQTLAADLKAAGDPNAYLAVLADLTSAVEKAYTGLEMLNISEDNFRNIKLSYYDYKGALDILAREGDAKASYTDAAARFNKLLGAFPASLYAGILNIDPLTVYGG